MAKYTKQDVKDLAQLMRSAKENGNPFAILTGAGCSIAAGIPSAPGLLRKLNESTFAEVLRRRLDCKDLCDCDYGDVMGQLPLADRKAFLEPILANAKVNWGYIALATLMKKGFLGHVLTFNFDGVLARAAGICGFYPAIYDFGVAPANKLKHLVQPSIVHLHGQGHGAVMMNTAKETEEHAQKLLPLFKHTFESSGLLVLGYSGKSDKVFPHICDAFENEQWLYWCDYDERAADARVQTLLEKGTNTTTHLRGVNFDTFVIELAQELETFPPDIFAKPADHLLAEIEPIKEPPAELQVAADIFKKLKAKLVKWKADGNETVAAMQSDLLAGQPERVRRRRQKNNKADVNTKEARAWAEILSGNEILDRASTLRDGSLFPKSIEKYKLALEIWPESHDALNNWGVALSRLAVIKGNIEELFREAITKYEAAIAIKADKFVAFDGWAGALLSLHQISKNKSALTDAEIKARRAQILSGNANYNLACVFALRGDEIKCKQQLISCKSAGTLPPSKHLEEDKDLEAYRLRDWFKALLV